MNHFYLIGLFATALLLTSFTTMAQDNGLQSRSDLQTIAQDFLTQQTATQSGQIYIKVSEPDARLKLPKCVDPEAFLPNGARLSGRTLVGVRCTQPSKWQAFIPANIRVVAPAWVVNRPLPAGSQIELTDLRQETIDVTASTVAFVTHPDQAVGKTLSRAASAGLPLRLDALKSEETLAAGDVVRVDAVGQGFKVSAEGRTLGSAGPGQSIRVKMSSGQVLTGTVRAGKVVELML